MKAMKGPLPPKWTSSALWICTKCEKSFKTPWSGELPYSEDLKGFLKKELKSLGQDGGIRVMTSSCLGVCPTGEQAICVVPLGSEAQAFVYPPEDINFKEIGAWLRGWDSQEKD